MYWLLLRRFLAVLLSACLLLPGLEGSNLQCFFCPLQSITVNCTPVQTVCPPRNLCFTAKGRYGKHVALSARGCLAQDQCYIEHRIPYKGTNYTINYNCCNSDFCNSSTVATGCSRLLTMLAMAASYLLTR